MSKAFQSLWMHKNLPTGRVLGAALVFALQGMLAASPVAAMQLNQVEISFSAQANGKPIACGDKIAGIGSTGADVSLQDFRIYVSNVRLVRPDGVEVAVGLHQDGVWQNRDVALLDFENATGDCNGSAATNTVVTGIVPAGAYSGLVFDIGVPVSMNHQDTSIAPAPLNLSALTWPWRFGYKFTTIDLETSGGTAPAGRPDAATGFSIHLGSIDCGEGSPTTPPETPCRTPNRPSVRLDGFNQYRHDVVFDLAALLAETDVTRNHPESVSGCMSFPSDDDCVKIMDKFGLTFRGKASAGQTFVRAVAKP